MLPLRPRRGTLKDFDYAHPLTRRANYNIEMERKLRAAIGRQVPHVSIGFILATLCKLQHFGQVKGPPPGRLEYLLPAAKTIRHD